MLYLTNFISKRRISSLLIVFSSFFYLSCVTEESISPNNELIIPESVFEQIESIGYVRDDLQLVMIDVNPLDNIKKERFYLLQDDILIPEAQFQDYISENQFDPNAPAEEQYRTNNLVRIDRINLFGFNNGQGALPPILQTALRRAVNRYEELGLEIIFDTKITSSNNSNGGDIFVALGNPSFFESIDFSENTLAVADSPMNGRPGRFIVVNSAFLNQSLTMLTAALTHEIGHTLGLRHTDWADRSRSGCSRTPDSESAGPLGAILIPGTPVFDPESIMISCQTGNLDFSDLDKVALRRLYGGFNNDRD